MSGLPLQGQRIVITRAERQAAALAEPLRALGAEPIILPLLDFAPPEDWQPVDAAIARLPSYDWVVFTSANGVDFFWRRLAERGNGGPPRRVAAIGPATATALQQRGIAPAIVAEEHVGEALADALGDVAGQHILLARAAIARQALADILRGRGATVDDVAVYRTIAAQPADLAALLEHPPDAITFTSASTVRHFAAQVGAEGLAALRRVTIACIGPITAEAARALGLTPHVVATEYTTAGLVAALVAHARQQPHD